MSLIGKSRKTLSRIYNDPAPGARLLRNHEVPVILPPDEHADVAKRIANALN